MTAAQSKQRFPSIEASFEPSLNQARAHEPLLAQIQGEDIPPLETVNEIHHDNTDEPGTYRALDSKPIIAPWQSQEVTRFVTPKKPSEDVILQTPPQPPHPVNSLPQTITTKPLRAAYAWNAL